MSGGSGSGAGTSGPWTLIIALVGFFAAIVLLVGAAVALRLGPFERPPGTPRPSTSASAPVQPTSIPSPTAERTANATGEATATPTASTPTQTPQLPRESFDSPLAELLSHVPEAVIASCEPTEVAAVAAFLAGVQCSVGDSGVGVEYYLYESSGPLYEDYDETFRSAEIDPDSGRCYDVDGETINATPNRWPAEHGYSVGQQPVGRYLCLEGLNGHDVYWTDERFNIIGIARGSVDNLDRLVRFWLNEAGPLP